MKRPALILAAALCAAVATGCLGAPPPDPTVGEDAAPSGDNGREEAPAPAQLPSANGSHDPFLPDAGTPPLVNDSSTGETDFPGPEPEPASPKPGSGPVDVLTPKTPTNADEVAVAA